MSEKTYKAIKYIRLSNTDDRETESDSVANQRKIIDSFIQSQPDIEGVAEMVDDGVTGVIFDRPAFKQMMEEILAGKINCVIVKDLSRMGRDFSEVGRHLRQIFPAYGVRFIALVDDIDTLRDSADNLVISLKSILNESYSRDISAKTRSALSIKRENGDFVGAYPVYGYKKAEDNRNQLVIDEYPAGIVRDIFRMKLEGMSASKIAQVLNNLGVLSPLEYKKSRGLPHAKNGYCNHNDAKWSPTAIIRILNDETYTGTLIQGRQGRLNFKLRDFVDKPKSEWKRSENAHQEIIAPHTFDLAQKIMRLDTRTAPGGDTVYIFSGVLVCGICGGRMTRKTNRSNGRLYHYYYCPTTKKRGCAASVMLREDDLTGAVLESVKAHVVNVASIETIMKSGGVQRIAKALANQYRTQIDDNRQQLEKINTFKSSLYENMVTNVLSKDEYKTLKTKYFEDERRLSAAIETLTQELEDTLAGKTERLRWMEHFSRFEELTALDRKTIVNLISYIRVVGKRALHIRFNYQDEYESVLSLLQKEAA